MKTSSFDITSYDQSRDPWYSPKEILDDFELLRSVYGENIYKSEFKRAHEMFTAAVALLGTYELSSENVYWLQRNRQSDSPDVMAAQLINRVDNLIQLGVNQMEITEFESHFPSDDIVEFLTKVKLSKSYDSRTIIVCLINREVPINPGQIRDQLVKIHPKFTIFIMGRLLEGEIGVFTIFSPYPRLTYPLQYNVNDVVKKYNLPSPLRLSRGMAKKVSFEKIQLESQDVNIYNIFGLDEKKIKAKYGKI